MTVYHLSGDGQTRPCQAQSPDRCTARGADGDTAPHGNFSDPGEARSWAEGILSERYGLLPDGSTTVVAPRRTTEYGVVSRDLPQADPGVYELPAGTYRIVSDDGLEDRRGWESLGSTFELSDFDGLRIDGSAAIADTDGFSGTSKLMVTEDVLRNLEARGLNLGDSKPVELREPLRISKALSRGAAGFYSETEDRPVGSVAGTESIFNL